jgi:predicted RNase H-like HicB family nuclease
VTSQRRRVPATGTLKDRRTGDTGDRDWAEIADLPGVFASGDTVDEFLEGLKEAVARYLGDGEAGSAELSELKLAVTT